MSKKVLLTGASGFVGHHCLKYFLEKCPDWDITCLCSFRHKGTCLRLEEVGSALRTVVALDAMDRVRIFRHDLTVPIDLQLENLLLERSIDDRGNIVEKKFDYILNFAADSAVERSVTDPIYCWNNNCALIGTMLEFARKNKPDLFLQISTDEVYSEAPPLPSPGHKEWSTIMPSNIYSASKAAQEAACFAYFRSYDLPVVITNTLNVVGERQDPEKFLPKIIQFVAQGKRDMPIYADKTTLGNHNHIDAEGQPWYIGSRFYIDARCKADALMFLTVLPVARYSNGIKIPDRYNICGSTELNNLELALLVAEIMGKPLSYKLVASESARPGYDRRYALDGTKLRELGWKEPIALRQTIERVVHWTIRNQHWCC